MQPILGYWNIRGLAQPIRFLLHYASVKFEDKLYVDDEFGEKEWAEFKAANPYGFAFPNLPYYVDENVKICQSSAILRYLARKHNLVGKTDEEITRVDELFYQLQDLRSAWSRMCYSRDLEHEKLKAQYLDKTLPTNLNLLEKYVNGRKYSACDHITFVDFFLFELLDAHVHVFSDLLDRYPNLKAYHQRIQPGAAGGREGILLEVQH